MKTVNLSLLAKHGDPEPEKVQISGQFSDADWLALLDFAKYTSELEQTEFRGNPFDSAIRISFKQGEGGSIETRLPTSEAVGLLLHRLRRLVLVQERTYFHRVRNILSCGLSDRVLQDWLKEQKEIYSGQQLRNVVEVRSNGTVVNSEATLQTWLNGFDYHGDLDRMKAFEDLSGMLGPEGVKAWLVPLLREKVVAIQNLARLIRLLDRPGGSLQLGFRSRRS